MSKCLLPFAAAMVFVVNYQVGWAAESFKACEFDRWKGAANEEAAVSYVGVGFFVDDAREVVSKVFRGRVSEWISVETVRSEDFTTYIYHANESDEKNNTFRSRYSFRVYETGRCTARIETTGFTPIIAEGRLR